MGAQSKMNKNTTDQLADTAAGVSVVAFGLTLAQWESIVSIGAGIVAIIAGAAAAWYHISRTRQLNDKMEEVCHSVDDMKEAVSEMTQESPEK